MTLNAFLPGNPGRFALGCSALAMMVPTALALRDGILNNGAAGCGPGSAVLASLAIMPLAIGGLGYGWRRAELRVQALRERMAVRETTLMDEARHDPLTGLHNRLALKEDVEAILARPELPQQALLLLDLDRFKFVNDTLGHDAGDELLVALARRLEGLLRDGDRLYRLGGDEFVILMDDPDSHYDIDMFCFRVEMDVSRPYNLAKGRVGAGVSIGIAFLRVGDEGLADSLKRADLALYKAKETAGSAHVFFTEMLAAQSLLKIELERDLAKALADEEFFLEYQPIVGVETGAIRSFEALVRWNHPEKGMLPPQTFIPLAERSGVIVPLGRWVMRAACLEAAKWPSPTGVAVNVAGDQFKDRSFVDFVQTCLREARLAPGRLTIEVTESLFTIDIESLSESLAALRALGVRIALDDFGTGFSSISHLKNFPLDQLKIDRSFARAMLADRRDGELVDLIARLGDTFNVSTTIEGIETEGQMDFVRGLGLSEAQGFLFARPMPADQVQAFFDGQRDRQAAGIAR
nr:bifunctional diguanylate cyclase/phosphodiesterase [uncultured Gellertiella sp.]